MSVNMKGSEAVAVIGAIDPDANGIGTVVSDYADMGKFNKAMAIIFVGNIGASGTVDAKLLQATDISGTGAKDITGRVITQLVDTVNDDEQAIINVSSDDLDLDNGFYFIAISMTTAVAAGDSSAVLLGIAPRHGPASDFDLATVSEIV